MKKQKVKKFEPWSIEIMSSVIAGVWIDLTMFTAWAKATNH